MDHWKDFVDWCQNPSKVKVHTFNPKNITLIAFSILLISIIVSGTWVYPIYQVHSITRERYPIFTSISGDGTKIAYTSYVGIGVSEIFVVNSDGTGLT